MGLPRLSVVQRFPPLRAALQWPGPYPATWRVTCWRSVFFPCYCQPREDKDPDSINIWPVSKLIPSQRARLGALVRSRLVHQGPWSLLWPHCCPQCHRIPGCSLPHVTVALLSAPMCLLWEAFSTTQTGPHALHGCGLAGLGPPWPTPSQDCGGSHV